MRSRPLATLTLLIILIIGTFLAPAFDSSVYGVNGHPTEWLSFMPEAPLRTYGLTLIFSPFLHLNLNHLVTNLAFFIPVALIIERKKSAQFLALQFFFIHALVLIFLVTLQGLYPLNGKGFLGVSHIVIGLFSFWSIDQKKMGMFLISVMFIMAGFWQGTFTLLVHTLGFLAGLLVLLVPKLFRKIRS